MHRLARVRQPEGEQETLRPHTGQIDPHVPEIDLRLRAWKMVLQHEGRLGSPPGLGDNLRASAGDVVPHRRVRGLAAVFVDQPCPDPFGRVFLLPRRGQVRDQHVIDQRLEPFELRRDPHRPLAGRRNRRLQGRAHRSAMHTVAVRQRADRQALTPRIAADVLEQLHPRLQPEPLTAGGVVVSIIVPTTVTRIHTDENSHPGRVAVGPLRAVTPLTG